MSAITGRYSPAKSVYQVWATASIHRPYGRAMMADHLRTIRKWDGTAEARRFSDYLTYLGTHPVAGGARWVNKYGTAPAVPQ